MEYCYKTKGVCPNKITFDLQGNIVTNILFYGGCEGNLKAISILLEGLTVQEITKKLDGNTCGFKGTSCADQLVQALKEASLGDQ